MTGQKQSRQPVILYSTKSLPSLQARSLAGRRVLLVLSNEGHAVQETLLPMVALEEAGADVDVLAYDGDDVIFDPLCNWMTWVERLWSPIADLMDHAERTRRFKSLPSIRELAATAGWAERLAEQYDAVLLPGGHGPVLAMFLRSAELHELLRVFLESGRVVGVECHAVGALAWARGSDGRPLIAGRHVTCWPRALEAPVGALPVVGDYLQLLGESVEAISARESRFVHTSKVPWQMPVAVIDDNLVTGWGPWTADAYGEVLVHALASAEAKPANVSQTEELRLGRVG